MFSLALKASTTSLTAVTQKQLRSGQAVDAFVVINGAISNIFPFQVK